MRAADTVGVADNEGLGRVASNERSLIADTFRLDGGLCTGEGDGGIAGRRAVPSGKHGHALARREFLLHTFDDGGGFTRAARGDVADANYAGIHAHRLRGTAQRHAETREWCCCRERERDGRRYRRSRADIFRESFPVLHRGAKRLPLNWRTRPFSSRMVNELRASDTEMPHAAAISSTNEPSGDNTEMTSFSVRESAGFGAVAAAAGRTGSGSMRGAGVGEGASAC